MSDSNQLLTVGEAAAATGLTARRVNQILDGGIFPDALFRRNGQRLIDPAGLPLIGLEDAVMDHLTPATRKRVMDAFVADPGRGRAAVGVLSVSLEEPRRRVEAGLERLSAARAAVDASGAVPVLKGTRFDVHELARRLADPAEAEAVRAETRLTHDLLEAAALYAKAYPRRGRPRRRPAPAAHRPADAAPASL